LVIFDVDGTLCDTFDVDDRVFCGVATKLIGTEIAPSSWHGAPQITDAGLVDWLWRKHLDRPPSLTEVETFIVEFEAALDEELARAPAQFREIAGAAGLLALLAETGWTFAFATGGWGRTARLKLLAAQLPSSALVASSDDSADRLTIFSLARARASTEDQMVVLVGDGVWDVKAALSLGWSFVGVGCGARESALRRTGAQAVLPDFSDVQKVVAALCAAPAPRYPDGGDRL
jgi:phosphoglycolate phosphatase-like HAD superfamily hydrolase